MYSLTQNPNQIRCNADGVVFNCIDGLLYYDAYKQWLAAGNIPNPLSQAEQFNSIERAIEQHMDSVAQADGWDNRWTCVARAGYANPWQQKGIKFGQWMDNCWSLVIQTQADVSAGTRPMPTPDQAIAALPPMIW